jgi:hypothetical protein
MDLATTTVLLEEYKLCRRSPTLLHVVRATPASYLTRRP